LGPIDPEICAAVFRDVTGLPIAIFVTYALHPAVLVGKDLLYSRDWVGPLTDALQVQFGAQVPVIFANGAEGNINHIDIHTDAHRPQSFDECARIGQGLAAVLGPVLAAAPAIPDPVVSVRRVPHEMRRRPITEEMLSEARRCLRRSGGQIPSLLDGIPDEAYAAQLLWMHKSYADTVRLHLPIVIIGPLVLACLPFEAFVELGLTLRHRHPEKIVRVVGLADDYFGYLPTAEAFDQGGYEPTFGTSTNLPGEAERLFDALSAAVAA
jgi:hypothetical protein